MNPYQATGPRPTLQQWGLAVLLVFTSILIGFHVADRRGVPVTAITQLVYAVVAVPSVIPPTLARVRDDALLSGGFFGPMAAVLLIDFSPLRLWLCLALGVVVGALGVAVKMWWQRGRWRRHEGDGAA